MNTFGCIWLKCFENKTCNLHGGGASLRSASGAPKPAKFPTFPSMEAMANPMLRGAAFAATGGAVVRAVSVGITIATVLGEVAIQTAHATGLCKRRNDSRGRPEVDIQGNNIQIDGGLPIVSTPRASNSNIQQELEDNAKDDALGVVGVVKGKVDAYPVISKWSNAQTQLQEIVQSIRLKCQRCRRSWKSQNGNIWRCCKAWTRNSRKWKKPSN